MLRCKGGSSSPTFGCFFFVQAEVVLGLHLITCVHGQLITKSHTGNA